MSIRRLWLPSFAAALLTNITGAAVFAQMVIPDPNLILHDAKHKEPKSGIEMSGNNIVIRSGVGTPTTINVLSFSRDGKLLAAGKDFGRVVLWDVTQRAFLCALDTGQGIVRVVAISPDDQLIATAGTDGDPNIKLWHLPDGKLRKSFYVGHPAVQKLAFGPEASSLLVAENNGVTYVLDTTSGNHKLELPGERGPVLSTDATTLMTMSDTSVIFRSMGDWQQQKVLPKPAKLAIPLSLDMRLDTYIYGDYAEEYSFVAVRASTGEILPNSRPVNLPKFNPSTGYFASLSPNSGLVFGHTGGRLWAWDLKTGKTCISKVLYSESGDINPDGSLLAGAIDNSIIARDKTEPGVGLWQTNSIREACGLQ
jgi:WD40 repeat protein